jgi:hypothetical protein
MQVSPLRSLMLTLTLLGAACQSTGGGDSGGDPLGTATTQEAKADKAASKKAEAKARKEKKRAHDLACAKTNLEVAELETQLAARKAADEFDDAKREFDEAKRALELFKTRTMPHDLADGRLGLDRAMQRKTEAEQELREMEATYAKDQFAKDTKELVLMRHKKQLEFATRSLELEEQEYADTEREKLPLKMRELEQKSRECERKLREAEADVHKTELENNVKLAKAKFEVEELQRPIEDDEEEDAKGKGGKS